MNEETNKYLANYEIERVFSSKRTAKDIVKEYILRNKIIEKTLTNNSTDYYNNDSSI